MRVWLTRSQPGADRAAAVLEKHGHCALVAPVVSISQIPAARPSRTFADVIFLSEHAVRFGVVSLTEAGLDFGSMRVFAVGSATAAWLADIGISAATPPVAGSEGLLALPEFADVFGTDVLIVAGVGGRNVLARGLVDRGARVEQLNVQR